MERPLEREVHDTQPHHASAIRELHARVRLETYPNEAEGVPYNWIEDETNAWLTPDGQAEFEKKLEEIVNDPEQLHRVVYAGDRLIGFIHGSKNGGKQELQTLYVDSDFHGQGVARDLLEELFAWFDSKKDIFLDVVPHNNHARSVYRHYGFEEVPGTERMYEETVPFITMKRKGKEA